MLCLNFYLKYFPLRSENQDIEIRRKTYSIDLKCLNQKYKIAKQ